MKIIGQPERVARVGDTAFDRVTASVPTYAEPWVCGRVTRPPAAVVLPYDRERRHFVLTRQPRIGALGALMIEAPAGKLESPDCDELDDRAYERAGEGAEAAARRELQEEVGLLARTWTVVATETYASPGYSNETMWLYLAEGLSVVPARGLDAYIEPLWLPLDALDDQIERYRRAAASSDPKKDLKTLALLQALKLDLLAA